MSRLCLSLLALLSLAHPAGARITASEVWEDWQQRANAQGLSLTAKELRQQNLLILERPVLEIEADGDLLKLRLDRLVLRDNPDGSVSVILPDSFPLTLDLPKSGLSGDLEAIVATVSAPDLEVSVFGLDNESAYRIAAPSLSLTLIPPPFTAEEELALTVALADLTMDYRQDLATRPARLESTLALGTLHFDGVAAQSRDESVTLRLDLSAAAGEFFAEVDPEPLQNPLATLPELMFTLSESDSLRGSLEHGPIDLASTLTDTAPGPTDLQFRSDGGSALVQFERGAFSSEVRSGDTGFVFAVEDPEVPVGEIDFGYEELGFGVTMRGTGPVDPLAYDGFARLNRLELGAPVWDGFDPDAALPRDPISLAIELSGELVDKPRTREREFGEPADVEVRSISLDALDLSGLGVVLSGTGEVTLDYGDPSANAAVIPTGGFSFAASGVNALLDALVKAGLIPAEDLMPLRLGLALVARPGEEPDSLTSDIDLRDGKVFANGQQLD